MPGHCILSHGLNSSPAARKVTALAQVAQALGWSCERPDYSEIDASAELRDIQRRLDRLLDSARVAPGPLVLVGSSMGAYVSALASLQVEVAGLFLMAPPVALPGYRQRLDAAAVPLQVCHGWHDELIAAQDVVDWCRERSAPLLLLDDNHRLEASLETLCDAFARFLKALT